MARPALPGGVALEDGGLTFPSSAGWSAARLQRRWEQATNKSYYEYAYLMQGRARHAASGLRCPHPAGHRVSAPKQDVLGAKRETVGLYNPTAAQSR